MFFEAFAIALISASVIAITCPDLPIGQSLRKALESVRKNLRNASRTRLVIWGLLFVLIVLSVRIAIDIRDGMAILQAIPEALQWFVAYDVATYVEIMGAVWLARSALGLRLSLRALASAFVAAREAISRAVRARHVGRRTRSLRPPTRRNANDVDEDADGLSTTFNSIGARAAGA